MNKIFFVGDTHFGDETIIKLENRPFTDVKHQTEELIKLWNSVVDKDDIVYVVGDFIKVGCENFHINKLCNLNGTKYLIKGNHDTAENDFYINNCGFKNVYEHPIILDEFWIVSHEPQYINKNFPYANIFAHVHNNPIYTTHSCRSYCVSAERTMFMPISFDEIKKIVFLDDAKETATKTE